jgi:ABC-type transport system involved in cytochrome c biogenesis ATPase subunit
VRLTRIEVDDLFGIFSHKVALNTDDRITIIHGPNGFGKTVMLRLISGFFGTNNSALRTVPFRRFALGFDDGSQLTVRKPTRTPSARRTAEAITFELKGRHSEPKEYALPDQARVGANFPLSYVEHEIPYLDRVGLQQWRNQVTGELLSLDDVLDRFSERFPPSLVEQPSSRARAPEWLTDLRSSIPTHFIQAHRLFVQQKLRTSRSEPQIPQEPAVIAYANELSKSIEAKLADYASLSQALDRSFPVRVVAEESPGTLTAEDLRSQLNELENRRIELRAAGVLDTDQDVQIPAPAEIDDRTKALLSVYLRDTREKLGVFDELASQTELLKEVLNQRFLNKTLEISRDAGIALTTRDGRNIPLTVLSSGEQHELVLLYELLFKVAPNSLILLDEPELSLHVAWQEAFLRDLIRITSLRSLDVLVATHSPQIISDRWDLTVELSGPESE